MSNPDDSSYPNQNHHDVFISYAQLDKPIADAICAKLESRHIRCWIAPRDVSPGRDYPEAIIEAIENSKIMILIFSSHANASPHVIRELTKAVNKGRIIVPFRIEDVAPSKSMEYLISVPHWLDAITPPLEKHIDSLAKTIEHILSPGYKVLTCPKCNAPLLPDAKFCDKCGADMSVAAPLPPPKEPVSPEPPAPSQPPQVEKAAPVQPPVQPAPPPEAAPEAVTAAPPGPSGNKRMIVAAVVIIVILAVLAVAFPTITASLQNLGGIDGKGTVTPGVTPVSTQTIDYRGEGAPINLVTFTAGPTQAMSKETALVIETNKDSTNAMVTVQFAGGGGLGLVQDNRVVLTRSDGTVTEGKLNFNQKGSDVSLQGTRGTDRLQVIVTMYSGATYTIVDKLMPYRVRG